MKKALRKLAAVILTVTVILNAATITSGAMPAGAEDLAKSQKEENSGTRASDIIKGWSPLLSQTAYGADVDLKGVYSGTLYVELKNQSTGCYWIFNVAFTNATSVTGIRTSIIPKGTYTMFIVVTVTGKGAETRTATGLTI
jgi:hypothetical protein